jgi:hypothetical protein
VVGKSRSSKIERIVSPTAPVAPTTQTLNFLLQVLKELLGHEYGPVVVTLMIVISLAVKIFPHITEFRKGKAKKATKNNEKR